MKSPDYLTMSAVEVSGTLMPENRNVKNNRQKSDTSCSTELLAPQRFEGHFEKRAKSVQHAVQMLNVCG